MKRRTAATAAVLCGLSIMVPASAASAASAKPVDAWTNTSEVQVDDGEAAGFARQRNISLADARQRLAWQAVAPDLSEVLARDLGDRFGAVWIDVDDGDRVKVGVVGGADPEVATAVRIAADAVHLADAGYDLVPVRHAWATIEADNDWLGQEIARVNDGAAAFLTAGLRPDLNAVHLRTPRQGTLTAAQLALVQQAKKRLGERLVVGSYDGRLEARACTYPYCSTPLRGGVRIHAAGIGGCTAGFVAKSKVDAKLYLFTAGHCAQATGTSTNWTTKTSFGTAVKYIIGKVWNWKWNTDGDMAIIRINDAGWWDPEPWVVVTDGPDTTQNQTYHISSDKTSVYGMRICTTGGFYGRSDCGFVTELGMTATYSGGVTVHNLGRGSFCGTGGDSGSPMYALHAAYGLQVGGYSECDSVYQGIKAAEVKLNVDVLH